MGAYLDRPATSKDSRQGGFRVGSQELEFAVSEMQGWRKSMEDATIARANLDEGRYTGVPIFAVFDGHGGREVSAFCARYIPNIIAQNRDLLDKNDMTSALRSSFHLIDNMLRDGAFGSELARLRSATGHIAHDAGESQDGSQAGGISTTESACSSLAIGAATPQTSLKESMRLDVKKQMEAAEAKGELSKAEALELVMKMLKLKKMDTEAVKEGGGGEGDARDGTSASRTGVTIGNTYTDAGCTAIVATILDNKLYVANAGDSRGVLCRNGHAVALSNDHKPLSDIEQGRIRAAGGYVNEAGRVNGCLNLSRSIGDLRYKVDPSLAPERQIITAEPDVLCFELTAADEFFILACDGVFDVLTNEELVRFAKQHLSRQPDSLTSVCEAVFDHCICDDPATTQGIGADNMSMIICLLKPMAHFT